MSAIAAVVLAAVSLVGARDDTLLPASRWVGEELAVLREAHPDLVQVESIGRTPDGDELWLATISRGEPNTRRPAVALCAWGRAGARRDARDVVAVARAVLDDAVAGGPWSQLLDECSLYVLPALDPDAPAADEPASESCFESDFPLGWAPDSGGSTGPYPLHRAQTRAFALFLEARPNLAALVTLAPEADEALPTVEPHATDTPTYDVAVLRGRYPRLVPRRGQELGRRPASAVRWCEDGLGLPVLALTAPSIGAEPGDDRELLRRRAATLVSDIAGRLPRLFVADEAVEALEEGLWLVDVAIENGGGLSTRRAGQRWQPGGDDVRVEVTGARVRASAVRTAEGSAFEPLELGGGALIRLGHLDAGERRFLRLVVELEAPEAEDGSPASAGEASAGGRLALQVGASRAVSDRREIELR